MTDNGQTIIMSPADFADTGQWRLLIYISSRGMQACLKHISDKTRPIVMLFKTEWDECESAALLAKIENAVYDHPALLDDYATEIILETPLVTWMPSAMLEEVDGMESTVFQSIFPRSDAEICTDRVEDMTALFMLADGLDGFISRTIPGARIRSHLAVLAEKFLTQNSDCRRLYIDIRQSECDILGFDGRSLLCATTHGYRTVEDIAYRVFHLLNAFGIPPEDVKINVSGMQPLKSELISLLRQYCGYVVITTLPGAVSSGELPLAAALQAFSSKNPSHKIG